MNARSTLYKLTAICLILLTSLYGTLAVQIPNLNANVAVRHIGDDDDAHADDDVDSQDYANHWHYRHRIRQQRIPGTVGTFQIHIQNANGDGFNVHEPEYVNITNFRGYQQLDQFYAQQNIEIHEHVRFAANGNRGIFGMNGDGAILPVPGPPPEDDRLGDPARYWKNFLHYTIIDVYQTAGYGINFHFHPPQIPLRYELLERCAARREAINQKLTEIAANLKALNIMDMSMIVIGLLLNEPPEQDYLSEIRNAIRDIMRGLRREERRLEDERIDPIRRIIRRLNDVILCALGPLDGLHMEDKALYYLKTRVLDVVGDGQQVILDITSNNDSCLFCQLKFIYMVHNYANLTIRYSAARRYTLPLHQHTTAGEISGTLGDIAARALFTAERGMERRHATGEADGLILHTYTHIPAQD